MSKEENEEIGKKSVSCFIPLSASEKVDENTWAGRKDQQVRFKDRQKISPVFFGLASPKAVLLR